MKTLGLVAVVALLAGCGSSSSGGGSQASAPAHQHQTMRTCMTSVGLGVKTTGPGQLNVLSFDGKLSAEITVFKSSAAARKFADQLAVPGYRHGRRVVVWDAVAQSDSSQRGVIADCLAKPLS